jgi:putative transposase
VPGYTINPDGTIVMDQTVVQALRSYRSEIEFSNAGGYHKLKHYLRRDYGYFINHKKLYRLCGEHSLLLPRNRKKVNKVRKLCENRVINAPNRLWQFDIKYGYIHGENRYFFILVFIDVFLRKIVGYHVGLSCKAGDLVFTLDQALIKAKVTDGDGLAIRSDNGPQMTSNMMRDYLEDLEIELDHEFIPPRMSNKNAHIESFNSILEVEFLQTRYFRNFGEAYKQTVEFIEHYQGRRIHGSLRNMAPTDAERAYNEGKLQIEEVRA